MNAKIIKIEVENNNSDEQMNDYTFLLDPIKGCTGSIQESERQISKYDKSLKKTEETIQDWTVQQYENINAELAVSFSQIREAGNLFYTETTYITENLHLLNQEIQNIGEETVLLVQVLDLLISSLFGQDFNPNQNTKSGGGSSDAGSALSFTTGIASLLATLEGSNTKTGKRIKWLGGTGTGIETMGSAFTTFNTVSNVFDVIKDITVAKDMEDPQEASLMITKGVVKATTSSIGAIIGNMIFPVIGGFIGGGIGDLIGNAFGFILDTGVKQINKEKLAMEQAKYSTKELKDALADTNITVEEFAKLFDKAVGEDIQNHFQGVVLSLQDIQKISQKIVFGDNFKEVQKFANITKEVQQSLSNLEGSSEKLDQWTWKLEVGIELEPTEKAGLKSDVEALVKDSKDYLEKSYYEKVNAIELLVGKEEAKEILEPINQTFLENREELLANADDLLNYVNETENPDSNILREKVGKVQEVNQRIIDAQEKADMATIVYKYGGKLVSLESFQKMHEEISQYKDMKQQTEYTALRDSMAALNEALEAGHLEIGKYDIQKDLIQSKYREKIDNLNKNITDFELSQIVGSYKTELNSFLPDLKEEELQEYIMEKIELINKKGLKTEDWDANTLFRYIGMDLMQKENFRLSPDAMDLIKLMKEQNPYMPETQIEDILMRTIKQVLTNGEPVEGITVDDALNFVGINSLSKENMGAFWKLIQEMSSILAVDNSDEVVESMKLVDPILFYKEHGMLQPDGKTIILRYDEELLEIIKNTNFMDVDLEELLENYQFRLDSAFSNGFEVNTNIYLKTHLIPVPSTNVGIPANNGTNASLQYYSQFPVYMGGDSSSVRNLLGFANGNIISSPTISLIGEAGPEAIIPLSPNRRNRGISLWEQAGEMLGMVSAGDSEPVSYSAARQANTSGDVDIQIDVQLTPSFNVTSQGENGDTVVTAIQSHLMGMADELSGQMAEQLQKIFSNMPLQRA